MAEDLDIRRKILIVEDNEHQAWGLKRLLQFELDDVEIDMAHDGVNGLRKALDLKPDVIILDLQLPGMGGLEVLEELIKKKSDAKVIVWTGNNQGTQEVVRAAEMGVADYLEKGDEEAAKDVAYSVARVMMTGKSLAQVQSGKRVKELRDEVAGLQREVRRLKAENQKVGSEIARLQPIVSRCAVVEAESETKGREIAKLKADLHDTVLRQQWHAVGMKIVSVTFAVLAVLALGRFSNNPASYTYAGMLIVAVLMLLPMDNLSEFKASFWKASTKVKMNPTEETSEDD